MTDGIADAGRQVWHHRGQLIEVALAVISTSSAGSRSSESASAIRRRESQRARCDARHARPATIGSSAAARETPRRAAATRPAIAVPAHLDDRRFERGDRSASSRPAAIRSRESRRRRSAGACVGRGEAHAERVGDGRATRVDVDQLDVAAGNPSGQPRHQAADRAGADHGDAIARLRARASHTPLMAVSRFAASTARAGGTSSGSGWTAAAGTT